MDVNLHPQELEFVNQPQVCARSTGSVRTVVNIIGPPRD